MASRWFISRVAHQLPAAPHERLSRERRRHTVGAEYPTRWGERECAAGAGVAGSRGATTSPTGVLLVY